MPRCLKSVLPVPGAKNRIRETWNFYAAQGGLVVYSGRKGDPGGGSSKVGKQMVLSSRFEQRPSVCYEGPICAMLANNKLVLAAYSWTVQSGQHEAWVMHSSLCF